MKEEKVFAIKTYKHERDKEGNKFAKTYWLDSYGRFCPNRGLCRRFDSFKDAASELAKLVHRAASRKQKDEVEWLQLALEARVTTWRVRS